MADEDYEEGTEVTLPAATDNSAAYFIEGAGFADPPPPEGNPAPQEPPPDIAAVEFYELEIE